MKTHIRYLVFTIVMLAFNSTVIMAQDTTKTKKMTKQQNHTFVDNDGDGYNDNAPDHDGDGIPNGLDPDWTKQKRQRARQTQFVDLNGDGINDNLENRQGKGKMEMIQSFDKENGSSLNNAANKNKGKGKGMGKK